LPESKLGILYAEGVKFQSSGSLVFRRTWDIGRHIRVTPKVLDIGRRSEFEKLNPDALWFF